MGAFFMALIYYLEIQPEANESEKISCSQKKNDRKPLKHLLHLQNLKSAVVDIITYPPVQQGSVQQPGLSRAIS